MKDIISQRERDKYTAPPVNLLGSYSRCEVSAPELFDTADRVKKVCENALKSEVTVKAVMPGVAFTRFEIEVASGVVLNKLKSLGREIEQGLAAYGKVRVEAPIPGKRAVGVEVPNCDRGKIGLHDAMQSPEIQSARSHMTFAVGEDIDGNIVTHDLEKMPHILIAGTTGSGKSTFLHSLAINLIYNSSPDELRFVIVDPKRIEFAAYRSMPHLLFDGIIYEANEFVKALEWAYMEMDRRYALLAKYGKSNISAFNAMPEVEGGKIDKIPHIVIIVDELADFMFKSGYKQKIENGIKMIASKARAAGIHLVLATQRPSADVITGTIKANITTRVAFKVMDHYKSNIILGQSGAEALLGRGDMLFYPDNLPMPIRVQGAYISQDEMLSVIEYIRGNCAADFDQSAYDFIFDSADVDG